MVVGRMLENAALEHLGREDLGVGSEVAHHALEVRSPGAGNESGSTPIVLESPGQLFSGRFGQVFDDEFAVVQASGVFGSEEGFAGATLLIEASFERVHVGIEGGYCFRLRLLR